MRHQAPQRCQLVLQLRCGSVQQRPPPPPHTHLVDSPPKAPMSRTRRCTAVPLNVSLAPSAGDERGMGRRPNWSGAKLAVSTPLRVESARQSFTGVRHAVPAQALGALSAPEQRFLKCCTATGAMSSNSCMDSQGCT
jgi:hypothetical protein